MRQSNVGRLAALLFCIAGMVHADGDDRDRDRDDRDAKVVTNRPPAATATMTLHTDANGCASWTVRGRVRSPYRGRGANVKLLCMPYNQLGNGGTGTVFPPSGECDGDVCPGENNVDSSGNFTFEIQPGCESPPQLDPTNFCVFVVHVDETKRAPATNSPPGGDPNGSAPCSGGYCPNSP